MIASCTNQAAHSGAASDSSFRRGRPALQKWLAVAVAVLVLRASGLAIAVPQGGGSTARVREQVRVLPAGSRLDVKLRNGDTLKGRLGPIHDDGFELRLSKRSAAAPVRVPFGDVDSFHPQRGLSTGAKIGLAVGIVVGVSALVAYLVLSAIARNG